MSKTVPEQNPTSIPVTVSRALAPAPAGGGFWIENSGTGWFGAVPMSP